MKAGVRECAELQETEGRKLHESAHGPCEKRRVRSFTAHGAGARTVEQWSVVLHGSLHGPCSFIGIARVINTGRVHEACALIFGMARGVLSSTRTVLNGCTGLV